MGSYLSEPDKVKYSKVGTNSNLKFAAVQMQGWRCNQEDTYHVSLDLVPGVSLFGVFDGHGGPEVARFVSDHFANILLNNQNFKLENYREALEETFLSLDDILQAPESQRELESHKIENIMKNLPNSQEKIRNFVGSTANVVLYVKGYLYVANLGDSKCLLQRDDEVIELSQDHLPYNVSEWERIEKAGGFVDDKGRLNGTLAMSRAFGDFEFKNEGNLPKNEQLLIAKPDIRKIRVSEDDQFVLLGTDGLFELFNIHEVMKLIMNDLKSNDAQSDVLYDIIPILQEIKLQKILESNFDKFIAQDTKTGYGTDNMTGILIQFK